MTTYFFGCSYCCWVNLPNRSSIRTQKPLNASAQYAKLSSSLNQFCLGGPKNSFLNKILGFSSLKRNFFRHLFFDRFNFNASVQSEKMLTSNLLGFWCGCCRLKKILKAQIHVRKWFEYAAKICRKQTVSRQT